VDSPYYYESELRCSDGLSFEAPPLASDALLTTLHPLLEKKKTCRRQFATSFRRIPPQQQLGITVTASLCITAAHCRQSMNFSNGPRLLFWTLINYLPQRVAYLLHVYKFRIQIHVLNNYSTAYLLLLIHKL
jgi:hypothetical protein